MKIPVNSISFYGASRGWRQLVAVICVAFALVSAQPLRWALEALGPNFDAILVPAIERAKKGRDIMAENGHVEKKELLELTLAALVIEIINEVPTLIARSGWGVLFGLAWLVLLAWSIRWTYQGRYWFGAPLQAQDPTWLESLGIFVLTFLLVSLACALGALVAVVISFCAMAAPYVWLFWIVPGLLALALAPVYYFFALPIAIHGVGRLAQRLKRS